MQILKQNKLLVWMLALITVFCAFIGVMLPTNNVVRADASFPDVSTWEEQEADSFKNIELLSGKDLQDFFNGKVYRIYLKNAEEADCYSLHITINTIDENLLIISFYGYGFEDLEIGKIISDSDSGASWTYKLDYSEEVGYFYDFMICFSADVSNVEVDYSFYGSKISLDELIADDYLVELVKPEGSSDKDNNIKDLVNNNFNLVPVLGSITLFVSAYVLFKSLRKKRK